MIFHAMTERYEEITVCGKPALFTSIRIKRDTVPDGLYAYDVRHDDECRGIPCESAPFVHSKWECRVPFFVACVGWTTIPSSQIRIMRAEKWRNHKTEGEERMKKFLMVLLSIAFVLNLTIVIGLIGGYGSPRRALYTITDELMNSAYRFKRGWQFKNRLPWLFIAIFKNSANQNGIFAICSLRMLLVH